MYEIIFKSSSSSTICKMRQYWLWTFELNVFHACKGIELFLWVLYLLFLLFVNYLLFRSSITENVDGDKKKIGKNVKCYLKSRNYNNFNIILIFLLFAVYFWFGSSFFCFFWFYLFEPTIRLNEEKKWNETKQKETDRNSIALIEFIFKWEAKRYEIVYTNLYNVKWFETNYSFII